MRSWPVESSNHPARIQSTQYISLHRRNKESIKSTVMQLPTAVAKYLPISESGNKMIQLRLHRLKGNSALPDANQSRLSGVSSDSLLGPQAIKPVLANQHHSEAAYSPPVAKLGRQKKMEKCFWYFVQPMCNLVTMAWFLLLISHDFPEFLVLNPQF